MAMKKTIVVSVIGLPTLWFVITAWLGINAPLLTKSTAEASVLAQRLQMPPGFSLSVFADKLPGARMLLITAKGDVLVSLPKDGKVMLLEQSDQLKGVAGVRRELVNSLNLPHGLAFYKDWLYIAETNAVGRIHFDVNTGKTSGAYQRIITDLPEGGNHWSRSLHFGPDNKLYLSVGSSCNVCIEKDPRRAALLRFTPEGQQADIFASGLRNTVGFAWQPATNKLYGVDNGRDFLGDNFPPCELNQIEQGGFYGWPIINGNQVLDPDMANSQNWLKHSIAPIHEFGAHTAPLSLLFLKSKVLRSVLKADALVTLHGSWNRSVKTGYKLVTLTFDAEKGISERDFITGFEENDDVIGKPVDIVEAADGSLYISDDFSGSIYKVSYSGFKVY